MKDLFALSVLTFGMANIRLYYDEESIYRFYVTVVTDDVICESYHLQCY